MHSENDHSSLGNIVVELGYCTKQQVEEGLAAGTEKLGEVLVHLDHLTRYQLEWAITCQGIARKQVNGAEMHAFARRQHRELIGDLHEITVGVRDLTAKINAKG